MSGQYGAGLLLQRGQGPRVQVVFGFQPGNRLRDRLEQFAGEA